MLQELGREAYVGALTAHRRLLRDAFTAHGGVEVEMQGDSFHFAFPYARDAVAAAVAGQRALQEHEWASQPIRVRIGLHTGEPIEAEGLYAGLDVHWAARVMSAGHGGQVLVSQRTAELVENELPAEIELVDLGEHRLKDLTAPQRLYQATATSAPAVFPPLKTLGTSRTNLPVAASPLIGREREVAELRNLVLGGARVVTVTGAGGSGKTRFALQAAADLVERFAGGVFWVPLAALTDPALVLPTIAQTLGVKDDLGRYLAERPTLLLLDNFEHLLDAAVPLSELLAAAFETRTIVTSRAPLKIDGEHEYPLEPLVEAEAVTLFLERSRAAGATIGSEAPIAQICRRLDNLPLAIELAAARAKLLPPDALLVRLEHRLPLLTGGRRDAPERHRTLRATIGWSYDLLDEPAQELFARLSVFAGDFSFQAAESVCAADLDGLHALIDWSLLKPVGHGRFLMLDTVHEFASACLSESGDLGATPSRHAEHYADIVATSTGASFDSLDAVQPEYQNVRAALAHVLACDPDKGLDLAASLRQFWHLRGHLTEGREWLRAFLARGNQSSESAAEAWSSLAFLSLRQGDVASAKDAVAHALPCFQQFGDRRGVADCIFHLSWIAAEEGDTDASAGYLEQNLATYRDLGEASGIAFALTNLGDIELARGNYSRAAGVLREALELHRESGDVFGLALGTLNLAIAQLQLGNTGKCASLLQESLDLAVGLGDRELVACSFEAAAAADPAEPERAVVLLGAADRLRHELGSARARVEAHVYERAIISTRDTLDETRFRELWQRGEALQLEEATRLAAQSFAATAGRERDTRPARQL
jgi:predicted ATPase